MATITIKDLYTSQALDCKAMASIRGAGAGWIYGWIRPFVPSTPNIGPPVNLFQFNNFGGQMNNQIQVIDIKSEASNSIINVAPKQLGINLAHEVN
jgi:hypothetical protein